MVGVIAPSSNATFESLPVIGILDLRRFPSPEAGVSLECTFA
jgi:hypothetical protein